MERLSNILNAEFKLAEASIEVLQKYMRDGLFSSQQITKMYLQRINDVDKERLNSVIEVNPDAMKIAAEMDRERKAGKVRGMMHGIPVLVKDNIETADRMLTTAGSIAMLDNYAVRDAAVIKNLRESGAVLLGKTNLSEWANFRSSSSISGWSSRGGQTHHPYVKGRNPSGSSSGSATAVTANLCAVSVGTETDGSIICPSSVNGIVGIKPSKGFLSQDGLIPISFSQDTAGVMGRTVLDAAILLDALRGQGESLGTMFKKDCLMGSRIGVDSSIIEGKAPVLVLFQEALEVLRNQGAEIIEVDFLQAINELGEAEFTVLQHEFKSAVNEYLSSRDIKITSLKNLIEFNRNHASQVMPYFGQELFEMCEALEDLPNQEYALALEACKKAKHIIDEILNRNNLAAICSVSNGVACMIDSVNGDYDTGFYFSTPAAIAGYPHITVPMGLYKELPVGISFISGENSDAALISMAYAYEQASLKRSPPEFKGY